VIRAIFFDFGGVLGRWDRAIVSALEEEHGLPEGGVLKALYGTSGWREVEIGHLPISDWLSEVDVALAAAAQKPLPPAHTVWSRLWNDIDRDVIGLAQRLRANHKIGVLSNTTVMLEDQLLASNGIHDMWDVIINSARVGVAKPDRRIYEIAAESIGVEPSACIHIDDMEANVVGAREAGFQAVHHVGDSTALEEALRDLGVEW